MPGPEQGAAAMVVAPRQCDTFIFKVCFYDSKDSIFHKESKPWRLPCRFVQNTKLGFYVMKGDVQGIHPFTV